jgi:late competence protein required for DNA uptake (superfamily II DNA/RNA helicase)
VATSSGDEVQTRTCRACGRLYKYPVHKSLATRFYCEACMRLDRATRETFEHYNKRIKRLTTALDKLQRQQATDSTSSSSS